MDAEATVRRLYGAMNGGGGSLLAGVIYFGRPDRLGAGTISRAPLKRRVRVGVL